MHGDGYISERIGVGNVFVWIGLSWKIEWETVATVTESERGKEVMFAELVLYKHS